MVASPNFLRQRLQFESLESRQLMAVSVAVNSSGVLDVRGDDTSETFTVYKSGVNTMVQATNSGVTKTYNMGSKVTKVEVRANGGDDTVNISVNLPLPAVIYGGEGVDTLNGGIKDDIIYGDGGHDVIHGGAGNDWLFGGTERDRLFGDSGNDYLWGENGDDFLDAGSAAETNVIGGTADDFNAYQPIVNGASFNDIAQRGAYNCFILAPMGEAAQHGVDLASRITYSGNGIYYVSLFNKNANGTYSPTSVLVFFDGTQLWTDPKAHFRGQEGESWTIIMNRAIATLLKVDLNSNTTGGSPGEVLSAITGRAFTKMTWSDASGALSQIYNDGVLDALYAVGNSRLAVASTNGAGARNTALFSDKHAYTVHSVAITGYLYNPTTRAYVPQYNVTLYNPHGEDNQGDYYDGLTIITGAEFKRSFGAIEWV